MEQRIFTRQMDKFDKMDKIQAARRKSKTQDARCEMIGLRRVEMDLFSVRPDQAQELSRTPRFTIQRNTSARYFPYNPPIAQLPNPCIILPSPRMTTPACGLHTPHAAGGTGQSI